MSHRHMGHQTLFSYVAFGSSASPMRSTLAPLATASNPNVRAFAGDRGAGLSPHLLAVAYRPD